MNSVKLGENELSKLSFIDRDSITNPIHGNRYILSCRACGSWKVLGKHCKCQSLGWYKNLIDIAHRYKRIPTYRDSNIPIGQERIEAIQNSD